MSEILIFDTSVLADDLRTGRHQRKIQSITGLLRTSSVVLAELWRGATSPAEQRFLRTLERNHPVLTPTKKNWLESGQILARSRAHTGFSPEKTPGFALRRPDCFDRAISRCQSHHIERHRLYSDSALSQV